MDVQLSALCDSAVDYAGKLIVIGTFDTISAPQLPFALASCSVALRLVFREGSEKKEQHSLRVDLADEAGNFVVQPLEGTFEMKLEPGTPFISNNFVFNFFRIQFERAGMYDFHVTIDGRKRASLPLRVMHRTQETAAAPKL